LSEQTSQTDEQNWQTSRMIGISYGKHVTYGFFEAIALSFKYVYFILKSTIATIFGIFAGRGTEGLVSLPGIVNYLGVALRSSLQSVLQLGVAISIGLAIANLLPLPALDGGRLVFIAIEKIFRKPVPRKVEGVIHFAGFVALMAVFLLIMYRDISRWIFGG
jgi:regulator of sigma E protease